MNIQGLPGMAHGLATAQSSSSGSSSSSSSSANLNAQSAAATFIQLLVTELKAQDPTSPMDPTTMVGQMFSMNQLQQLIDINQTLSTALGGVPSTPAGAAATSANGISQHQTMNLPAAASYAQQILKGAN